MVLMTDSLTARWLHTLYYTRVCLHDNNVRAFAGHWASASDAAGLPVCQSVYRICRAIPYTYIVFYTLCWVCLGDRERRER